MKSWRSERFGPANETVELRDIEKPEPAADQLLLKVRAAGVALPDVMMLEGRYPLVSEPPVSPGMEVVGDVVAAGSDADVEEGTRVIALARATTGWGGLSEYCLANASDAMVAPDALSDVEAAGFYVPFKTAHVGLVHRLAIKAGETLVVPGASGSSGSAAVVLGKALGATVIAIAGGEEKCAFVRACGADHVIDHRKDDPIKAIVDLAGKKGVNAVFDAVGGDLGTRLLDTLKNGGRMGIVGFASGGFLELDPHKLLMNNVAAVGIFAGNLLPEQLRQTYDELGQMVAEGRIKVPIGEAFPFDAVPDALRAVKESTAPGKIVVTMG